MTMDRIDKLFHCTDCKKSYKRKSDLNRLYRSKREKIVCPICDHHFNRKVNFKTHYRRFHKAAYSIQVGGNNQPPLSTKTKKTTDVIPIRKGLKMKLKLARNCKKKNLKTMNMKLLKQLMIK